MSAVVGSARTGRRRVPLLLVALAMLAACTVDRPQLLDGAGRPVGLTLLSVPRPELVSGDDVLVRVADADGVVFTANGQTLRAEAQPGDPTAVLLSGLPKGRSTLEARRGNRSLGRIEVTNHPTTGPIFSGPHQSPFYCTTVPNGLGPATDADCSAPTVTDWRYARRDAPPKEGLVPLADPRTVPADARMIEVGGRSVPLIVRRERGVINRSIYTFEVLEPTPEPDAPPRSWDRSAWNRRLVYVYGGGCGTGYTQGATLGADESPDLLGAGYATLTSTLNTFQVTCNDVISAEVTSMTREHVIETYGVPVHTIGTGGSGGAIQVHLISQNYPGLLDGIVASLPFPDAATIAQGVTDCGLLADFWQTPAGRRFDPAQQLAVQGHGSLEFCRSWISSFVSAVDPSKGCSPGVPADVVYDAERRPRGARCTLQDANVNLFGRDPTTGFARRPLDNTGVPYGLDALRRGVIDVDRFLDLNEQIGSYDIDGRIVEGRVAADDATLNATYGGGRVLRGDGNLLRIPVIEANPYSDRAADIHDRFRAFSVRDRMTAALGRRPTNQLIWSRPGADLRSIVDPSSVVPTLEMISGVDRWLDSLDETARRSGLPMSVLSVDEAQARLGATRPAGLTDDCVTPDGQRIAAADLYDTTNACTTAYPVYGDPRTAAGAPRRNDVIACRLQPATPAALGTEGRSIDMTPEQESRLADIFPDGVCDWSAPGRGQVPPASTWQTFPRI